MPKILIIGYGNPDRQDDGVAWHILQKLALDYHCPIHTVDDLEPSPSLATSDGDANQGDDSSPHLAFALQLTPEMAETLAQYERVCFVDAHTGAYPEEVRVAAVQPGYQTSPFTHHLTPESCLALAQSLYGHSPTGLVVSVRGYHFGYSPELSAPTAPLVQLAAEQIIAWIIAPS